MLGKVTYCRAPYQRANKRKSSVETVTIQVVTSSKKGVIMTLVHKKNTTDATVRNGETAPHTSDRSGVTQHTDERQYAGMITYIGAALMATTSSNFHENSPAIIADRDTGVMFSDVLHRDDVSKIEEGSDKQFTDSTSTWKQGLEYFLKE